MTRTALALILITLTACDQAPPMEAPYVWQPLTCDTVEEVTYVVTDESPRYQTRTVTTTAVVSVVSILDADPVSVVARVAVPDGFIYYDADTDIVTSRRDGLTRVLCSETHTTSVATLTPGSPTATATGEPVTDSFLDGGEYAAP